MGDKQYMSDEYILENGTLKNKLGITNQQALNDSERKISRNAELDMPSFSLDFEGLKKFINTYLKMFMSGLVN